MVLKDCFATLEEDEWATTERDKLDYLLDGIQNTGLAVAVSTISMLQTLRSSFEEAAGILLHEVQQLFPQAANRGKRTIAQLETNQDQSQGANMAGKIGGKGRGHGGRGNGRGGRGAGRGRGGGRVILNGVDVTDPNRTFTNEEWNKLKGQW